MNVTPNRKENNSIAVVVEAKCSTSVDQKKKIVRAAYCHFIILIC